MQLFRYNSTNYHYEISFIYPVKPLHLYCEAGTPKDTAGADGQDRAAEAVTALGHLCSSSLRKQPVVCGVSTSLLNVKPTSVIL